MALNFRRTKLAKRAQRGTTLIELSIATFVLLVGIAGSMTAVTLAIGSNGRNRQQSNSTAISQMFTERIAAQKAASTGNLTVTDCAGNTLTVATAVGGAPLTNGVVDYTQAAVTNYQALYVDCGTSGRQVTYDVRWNITQPTGYVKLLTVSTRVQNWGNDPRYFSLPVTVRTLIGQGT